MIIQRFMIPFWEHGGSPLSTVLEGYHRWGGVFMLTHSPFYDSLGNDYEEVE